MTWSGLYTPLITPFKKNGALDEEGLRKLLHIQQESGVEGVVLLGSTGEASTLSEKEKEQILSIGREEIKKLPIIVGTGTNDPRTTIENTKKAADKGADAVLVIAPYYNRPTQEGIFRHYEALSDSTALPIFIYNNPTRACVNIEVETLKKIASLPHVVGMKESSSSLEQFLAIQSQLKEEYPDFILLTGEDALLLPLLAAGANGGICGSANLIPKHIHTLIHCCLNHNFEEGRSLFYELLPLLKILGIEPNPIPLKFAMESIGLPAGSPRAPLTPLSADFHAAVKRVLEQCLVGV